MAAPDDRRSATPTQLVGLLLWRTGLMIVAGYSMFRMARLVMRYVDLPTQLEFGLGLALGGAALVLVSLVWERVQDARAEGDLTS